MGPAASSRTQLSHPFTIPALLLVCAGTGRHCERQCQLAGPHRREPSAGRNWVVAEARSVGRSPGRHAPAPAPGASVRRGEALPDSGLEAAT